MNGLADGSRAPGAGSKKDAREERKAQGVVGGCFSSRESTQIASGWRRGRAATVCGPHSISPETRKTLNCTL